MILHEAVLSTNVYILSYSRYFSWGAVFVIEFKRNSTVIVTKKGTVPIMQHSESFQIDYQ